MTTTVPDNRLVGAYVAEASEPAFQALVNRHVDLVYATALRQLGDAGMAEGVTQNDFIDEYVPRHLLPLFHDSTERAPAPADSSPAP